jgi:serine protease AprX
MKFVTGGFSAFFLFTLFMLVPTVYADAQQDTMRFMVTFSDKSGTPFQVSNPSAFLSERAIARRVKFNIAVIEEDLPVSPAYLDSLSARGIRLLGTSRWFNAALIETYDSATAIALLGLPYVVAVDLLYIDQGIKKKTSVDPRSGIKSMTTHQMIREITAPSALAAGAMQHTSGFSYGPAFAQANLIGASYLHQMGFTGDSLQIAVLDAGFTLTDVMDAFDSLRTTNRILSTKNFVDPNQTVYSSHFHGTYVLSVMAANQPGVIVGTAPHASYHLLLTEDIASEYPVEEFYWAQGAEYADSIGADMINSSLGYTTFYHPALNHQFSDMDGQTTLSTRAATMASRRGMLVMASAGNGGGSSWYIVGSPADADSILTVGAVDVAGQYAPFSSTGKSWDGRVKPDVVATGWNTVIANPWGGTFHGNGTSFSSPVLAGAVACLWQANPGMSNHQIMDAVKRSAHQFLFPDTLMGYGIPNLAIAHLKLGGMDFPDIVNELDFLVAPNPFINQIIVSYTSSDTQQVTLGLYDIGGRLLRSESANSTPGLNMMHIGALDRLSAGTYLLKITTGNHTVTRKVIRR